MDGVHPNYDIRIELFTYYKRDLNWPTLNSALDKKYPYCGHWLSASVINTQITVCDL